MAEAMAKATAKVTNNSNAEAMAKETAKAKIDQRVCGPNQQ
jgi:hypothetical protein